jgi:hypothetical protein
MTILRPTDSLDWAEGNPGNVLAPPSAKRSEGWLSGEAPPAQWMNWWKRLAGRWVDYLDDRIATLNTLTENGDALLNQQMAREIESLMRPRVVTLGSAVWRAFAAAGGLCLAVGESASIAYSQSLGMSWVSLAADSSFSGDFLDCDCSPTRAVFAGGQYLQSWGMNPAVTTVTTRASVPDWIFAAVRYGGAAGWVALATDGAAWRSYTSPDGITWTSHALATPMSVSLEYGAGLFVSSSSAGVPYTSPDGITWTARAWDGAIAMIPNLGYNAVHGFCAYGVVSSARRVQTSLDGLTWTNVRSGGINPLSTGRPLSGYGGHYAIGPHYTAPGSQSDPSWVVRPGSSNVAHDFVISSKLHFSRIVQPLAATQTRIALGIGESAGDIIAAPFSVR